MSAWFRTKLIGFRVAGYDVLRIVLGSILIVAAGLKCYQLGSGPVAESGLLTSRWFLIVVVEFELLFGLWLLAGSSPKLTWCLSIFCFLMFACVSLYEGICGRSNCWCFGNVAVDPRATFALDVVLVAALLRWRPAVGPGLRAAFDRALLRRGLRVLLVWLIVAVPAGYAMTRYCAAGLDNEGRVIGKGRVVLLEPKTWVGKRFPLWQYIDIGEQLSRGKWVVVLYRHDCPRCQEIIPRLDELARRRVFPREQGRLAFVEMAPYETGAGMIARGCTAARGRLEDVRDWFAETPFAVVLREGVVAEVPSWESLGGAGRAEDDGLVLRTAAQWQ